MREPIGGRTDAPAGSLAPVSPARTGRALTAQLLLAAGLTLGWAAMCNALLNLLNTGGDVGQLVARDMVQLPGVYALSTLALWAVLLLCVALTGRLFASLGIIAAGCLVLGYANHLKVQVRNEPLVPSDLSFATQTGFLMDMVTTSSLLVVAGSVLLILCVTVLCGRRLAGRFPPISRRSEPRRWWGWVAGRVVVATAVVITLAYVAQFNAPGNRVRAAYEASGAHWAFWYQKLNYDRHGAVAGFLYNLPTEPMEVPPGYSQERMAQIAAKYERAARAMNAARREARSVDDLNVVVLLSESFSDPTAIPGVELERDPIPFTRGLMSSNPSGSLLTQHFGGGTANMEYEALTGLSVAQFTPQHDTPYSMSVHDSRSYPSLVGYLEGRGHSSASIHPYMPTMYQRERAYAALGFDEFVSDEDMRERRLIDNAQFIADSSAFDEVLARLDETEEPDLVNVVTMQNHYPTDNVYDDPMAVSGVAEAAASPLGHFARGLEHSDVALRSFLASLEARDEPTAVIFYGDHQPALWEDDPRVSSDEEAMHRAPFLLWSNTGDLPSRRYPLVSPTQFAPLLFRTLGLEMPAYYALLSQVSTHVSAMGNGRFYSPDGTELDDPLDDPRTAELLEDYRLVQYDLAVGERYSLDRMFPQG